MTQLSKRRLDQHHLQWRQQGGVCFYCERNLFPSGTRAKNGGMHPRAATRDHIVAKVKGGTKRPRNIVIACFECNHRKAAREVSEFIAILNSPSPPPPPPTEQQ